MRYVFFKFSLENYREVFNYDVLEERPKNNYFYVFVGVV